MPLYDRQYVGEVSLFAREMGTSLTACTCVYSFAYELGEVFRSYLAERLYRVTDPRARNTADVTSPSLSYLVSILTATLTIKEYSYTVT